MNNLPLTIVDASPFIGFSTALIFGVVALVRLHKSKNINVIIKDSLTTLILLSNFLALAYCIMQLAWTLQGHAEEFNFWENIGWLVHDWLSALVNLSINLAVITFVKYKKDSEDILACGGKRSDCMARQLTVVKND